MLARCGDCWVGGAPCISGALSADDTEVVAEGETLLITIATDTRAATVGWPSIPLFTKNHVTWLSINAPTQCDTQITL